MTKSSLEQQLNGARQAYEQAQYPGNLLEDLYQPSARRWLVKWSPALVAACLLLTTLGVIYLQPKPATTTPAENLPRILQIEQEFAQREQQASFIALQRLSQQWADREQPPLPNYTRINQPQSLANLPENTSH